MPEKGMVYIFYGDGKGKTSAALGVVLRMVAIKKKVIWISWFKSLKWNLSEANLTRHFDNLKMFWLGEGFYIKGKKKNKKANGATIKDFSTFKEHKMAAKRALVKAEKFLMSKNPPDLLVLDEILDAVTGRLLTQKEILKLLSKQKNSHIILTGHKIIKEIYQRGDLVTNMVNEKHPFEKGVLAIRGLDF